MKTPYQILGVSPSDSDEDIKKAYHDLARKYHPDRFADEDMKELAQEKMKEINAAYEEIQQQRASQGQYQQDDNNQYQGYSSDPFYQKIRDHLTRGELKDAEKELRSVATNARTAEWFFLSGWAMLQRGYTMEALKYYSTACDMAPGNEEYRRARDQLRGQNNQAYQSYNRTQQNGCSTCDFCTALYCADCCCECTGGDLIRCC